MMLVAVIVLCKLMSFRNNDGNLLVISVYGDTTVSDQWKSVGSIGTFIAHHSDLA